MEVGLGPGDFVLDGTQLIPPQKGGGSLLHNSRPITIVAKWLDGPTWHLARRWALVQATLCKRGTQLPSPKRGLPQFSTHFYCDQTAGCIKVQLGTEVGLSPYYIVLYGVPTPPPPQKKGTAPLFGPCLLWPNGCIYQDTTFYKGRPQPRRHCVRWGPSPFPPLKGHSPQIFGPSLLWPNGWMHQDATWYGGRPRPTRHCVRCGPSYPQKKGTPIPPNFRPTSIVAK